MYSFRFVVSNMFYQHLYSSGSIWHNAAAQNGVLWYHPGACMVKTTTQQQGSGFLFWVQVKTDIFRFMSCWINKLHLKKIYMIRCWSHGNSAAKCQSFVWDNFNFLILKLTHDRLNLLVLLAGWQSGAGQRLLCGVSACCFRVESLRCLQSLRKMIRSARHYF